MLKKLFSRVASATPATTAGRTLLRRGGLALGLVLLGYTSVWAQALTGTKAIPGTSPSGYATLRQAIAALNINGVGAGGVTFNVAAGYTETFTASTSGAITTSTGTVNNPIVFQKFGTGANPLITAGAGSSSTLNAIISLSGTDYVTFDGIDLRDAAANVDQGTAMEAGFALFRATDLNGCQYNTIKNCTITLNRSVITSGASGFVYGIYSANTNPSSTVMSADAQSGTNSYNTFHGNTILNTQIGINLVGYTLVAAPYYDDQGNDVGGTSLTTGNIIQNYGGFNVATTGAIAMGIRLANQRGANASYNTIANVANGGVESPYTLFGINQDQGFNTSNTYRHNNITLTQGANNQAVTCISAVQSSSGSTTAPTSTLTVSDNTMAFVTPGACTGIFAGIATALIGTTGGYYNAEVITGNTLSGTAGAPMVVNTSSTLYFLYLHNDTPNETITNNTVSYLSKPNADATLSPTFYGYRNFSGPTGGTATITGNTISNITLGGPAIFEGIEHRPNSTAQHLVINNNTISNITGGTGYMRGLYIGFGDNTSTVSGNTITGLTGSGILYGIFLTNTSTMTAAQNVISNITGTGASAVHGLYYSSGTNNANANKIYDLSNTGGDRVYGINALGGTSTLTNNLVGNLTAPNSNFGTSIVGIYANTGTINAYHNTVYLSASSTGSSFGTAGIYANTSGTLDLRNNLVVNKSTAGSSGFTVAYSRSSSTLTSYASTSNNNLFYAGTPSVRNIIFNEGTTNYQTLANFKTRVAPRDAASVTEDVPFLSTNGADATFLHINASVATAVESGGVAISSVTTDYDGDLRYGATGYPSTSPNAIGQAQGGGGGPDIGADEGTFLSNTTTDVGITALTTPAASQPCYTNAETVTVTLQNFSATTLNFATNPVTVSGSVTGPTNTTLTPVIINTGTLAAGASRAVTFGTLANMAAAGTYTFAATTSASGGDANGTNNALPTTTRTVNPRPTAALASASPTTVCAGTSVTVNTTLTGTAPFTVTVTTTTASGTTSQTSSIPLNSYSLSASLTQTTTYAISALSDATGCPADASTLPSISFTVNTQATYTGAATGDESNWFNASNWNNGCVPNQYIDAILPAGLTAYPNLSTATTAEVRTLTLDNGASLTQSAGTLAVYGNLTNNTPTANVSLTGSTVQFTGSAGQTLGGSQPLSFANLTVNKASDTLRLATNQTVNGTLALSSGILKTYALSTRYKIALPGTLTETSTSFVLGDVEVPAANLSTDGATSSFGGLGLTLTAHALKPNGTSATLPGSTTVTRSTGTALSRSTSSLNKSIRRYYTITPTNDTNLNVDMVFGYGDSAFELNGISESNLRLFSSAALTGPFRPEGGTPDAGANTVTRTGLDHFSIWTLGDANAPLPVELTRFEVVRQGSEVALRWNTASEKNSRGFEVQVSIDGHAFETLSFVGGAGNSTAPQAYSYTDRTSGKTSLRYYRLRQLDLDGTATFSPVRSIAFDGGVTQVSAAPNPFSQDLMLTVQARVATVAASLILTDASGRVVQQQVVALPAGISQLPLMQLRDLPAGLYLLKLQVDGKTQHLKVMKQ